MVQGQQDERDKSSTASAQASTASAQTSKAPAQATTTIHKRQPEAIQRRQTQQQKRKREQPPVPHFRHTTKMPVPPQQSTAVPHPLAMSHNDDYWVREGHFWKRVHIQTRQELYVPQQTDDGADVTKLVPMRFSIIHLLDQQQRKFTINDDWHEDGNRSLDIQWAGPTNFEEQPAYKYELESDNEDDTVQAANKAKAVRAPKPPAEQERKEHELTHLPCRNGCAICVKRKGREDNHPRQQSKQPVIQMDFCYIEAFNDKQALPVLTAIDVETGMTMAVLVQDKHKQFNSLVACVQTFLVECGRAQATLSPTILQTDQENFLLGLLKAIASSLGNNVSVRQITGLLFTITRQH